MARRSTQARVPVTDAELRAILRLERQGLAMEEAIAQVVDGPQEMLIGVDDLDEARRRARETKR